MAFDLLPLSSGFDSEFIAFGQYITELTLSLQALSLVRKGVALVA